MRGFRTDSTRQQIAVTKLNRDISDIQLKSIDHQHALERAQRVLGFRVRGPGRGRRATVARSGDQARAGQPDARAGRHDGAHRRDLGAIRTGHAQPRHWSPRSRRSEPTELALKRLIVGGADDPNWSAASAPDGSTELSAGRDRSRRRGAAGAQRTHGSWTSRRRTSPANDVTLRYLQRPDAAAGRPRWRPTGWWVSAARS